MQITRKEIEMTDDIPDGWVSLASFDERKEKKRGGESGEYAALRKAIHAGLIDSMSVGRPKRLFVRKVQAENYLNAHYRAATDVAPVGFGLLQRMDRIEQDMATLTQHFRRYIDAREAACANDA